MDKIRRNVLKPGTRVGPCEVIELIGHGGMGDVYRATHLALNKPVALKLMAEPWSQRADCVEGFLREGRLASRLEDEHVVQIYDAGTDHGKHYIVMQLARGQSLRDRLKQSRLDVAEALSIIEKITRGLEVAHEAGIVHRDIKPHNIILTDDGAGLKILDFGLARFEQSLLAPGGVGEIVGSCAYMAPEQADFGPADARADLYSLGVTAYQCLTGSLPFGASEEGGNFELMLRHNFEQPQAPSLLNRAVPLTISRIVLKLLEKNPANRYATATALLDELRLVRRHSLPVAAPPWESRPLNPPTLKSNAQTVERFKALLMKQKEVSKAGKAHTPLSQHGSELKAEYQKPATEVFPQDWVELTPEAADSDASQHSVPQRSWLSTGGDARYRDRFAVSWNKTQSSLGVRVTGAQPLDPVRAQYLYDLLEAMPSSIGGITLSFAPDYSVAVHDVRWVVDIFNIAGGRGGHLTVVVASSQNHDTFVRLGLDQHIGLQLQLEGTLSMPAVEPPSNHGEPASVQAEAGTLPGMASLPPAARALAATLGRHLMHNELHDGRRVWGDLANEMRGRDIAPVRSLRTELYNKMLEYARGLYASSNWDGAGEAFNRLVDLDAARHEGYFGKALVFKKQGRLDYASAFLTQAILAAPDDAELFYHRAIVRSRMGDDAGALRDLSMAIEHNPRLANAYFNRSLIYKRQGRDDLSRRDLQIAQRLNPELNRSRKLKPRIPASSERNDTGGAETVPN